MPQRRYVRVTNSSIRPGSMSAGNQNGFADSIKELDHEGQKSNVP
jgi:hypothetical protein